ncbi:MAG: cell division protein FtsZ [Dehalococcoidia bacterium]|nr:cell division protein FtsZ [Dehalococcoidia bacterium]
MASDSGKFDGVANVKVIGVGGGGCNAVSRMAKDHAPGVDYVCVNTDAQALVRAEAPVCVRIGDSITRGLGVGGDPEKGRQSAEESREELEQCVRGTDMVFIAAGMGGGTGTGAAPVIAELARGAGALTVAVVTRPFIWEGAHRKRKAEEGIARLRDKVDTLLVIPNDALVSVCDRKVTVGNAFKLADEVLRRAIQSIAEIVTIPGDINVDFADVRTVMANAGSAMMGIGYGQGDNRATDAARAAITNPLLDVSIEGAKGVLFVVTGGADLTLSELNAAADIIAKAVDPNANIFFGMTTDTRMENEVKITLIATGFANQEATAFASADTVNRLLQDGPARGDKSAAEIDLDVPPFLRKQPVVRTDDTRRSKLPIGF